MSGKGRAAGGMSGGKRTGSGRKRIVRTSDAGRAPDDADSWVAQAPLPQGEVDMLKMLQNVALGLTDATPLQVRAAIAAVQYTHTRRSDGGKKDEAQERANKAASGRFAAKAPPLKLVAKAS
jgi:phage terminase small subunit